jgi:hypothetical protein
MNYTYCSHGNYWHACSDQECANLGHVTTAICEYCKLKDVRTEATMNKRGYELCQQCYDSQAKAERESDEFNEQFYKNQAILMKENARFEDMIADKRRIQLMKEEMEADVSRLDRLNAMADEIIKLRQQTSVLRGLLIELTDEDDCRYDHHGYCQAHSLDIAPCPHSRSRTLIKEMYL